MPMTRREIEATLNEHFEGAVWELQDLAGDDDHWHLIIKSDIFEGLSRVKQHQMVYKAFGGKMGSSLHALQLTIK